MTFLNSGLTNNRINASLVKITQIEIISKLASPFYDQIHCLTFQYSENHGNVTKAWIEKQKYIDVYSTFLNKTSLILTDGLSGHLS